MIWRKTKEFESISVSDDGQVRNDITGRIYKPTINKQGYCVITGPDRKQYKIHRLVAMAFQAICGSYCDNMVIDHLNTVRSDNRASNLMWVTIKGNMNINSTAIINVNIIVNESSKTYSSYPCNL